MPNTPRTDLGPPGVENVPRERLAVGVSVCVWNQFLERWSPGFAVAEVLPVGYRLRRMSDGHTFEDVFSPNQVIPERRRKQDPGVVGTYLDRRHPSPDE
jgi:hypothetical protein